MFEMKWELSRETSRLPPAFHALEVICYMYQLFCKKFLKICKHIQIAWIKFKIVHQDV